MKNPLRRIVPLILIIAIIASIGWYLFIYDREFTRDMLISVARFSDTQGYPGIASWCYDMAYEYTGQDEGVAIELANQYKHSGNYTKAEYTLNNAISDGASAELYIALCKTFVEQDKLLDAVQMLDSITDPAIKAEIDALRPAVPAADPTPGLYSQYISVTLTSEDGEIYCSTDGDYPSIHKDLYADSITLAGGETTFHAVNVAKNGLVSPLGTLNYTIGGVIEEVTFTDPAMEAEIRNLLGAAADQVLMTNELWDITEFTIPADTQVFDDLALLPYVQTLTVEDIRFPSLSCFTTFSELVSLNMTNCRFPAENLSILANLPSLQRLTLNNCGLSTISDLAGAQKLTYLDLRSNTLRNLEALSGMTNLHELNLQHNAVTDLSSLSSLSNLERLDVSYNAVTSLAPLAACEKLSHLDANHNSIASVEGLDAFPSLTHLILNHNQLSNISVLGNCTGLTELNVSNNALTDISALSTLTSLENFNFSHNEVTSLPAWPEGCKLYTINGSNNKLTSISVLKTMERLGYVYMDYNELTSIDSLANCHNLVMVNVYGNQIPDVSQLTAHDIIVNYDPT